MTGYAAIHRARALHSAIWRSFTVGFDWYVADRPEHHDYVWWVDLKAAGERLSGFAPTRVEAYEQIYTTLVVAGFVPWNVLAETPMQEVEKC